VWVPIDPTTVARVTDNLVVNVLRHAAGATTVWVIVRETDAGAELIVEDDGPGIPADQRESIFSPFQRGSTEASGSGLGLSIVAGFVDLHGGRTWVEERPGGGASFHAVFPFHHVDDRAVTRVGDDASSTNGVPATA
jgi:two-component system sensor histidine kinase MtrB